MTVREMNETDVREEIATPFLTHLGYKWGTDAQILRELSLSYPRIFLGRKKINDPPLRGKADYVLSVVGYARWVLEVKSPADPIDKDAIEQAMSYARHPEVSGHYVALLDGLRFVLFQASQTADDAPIADICVASPEQLAELLTGILSPEAIRRKFRSASANSLGSFAKGWGGSARFVGGSITYRHMEWGANVSLPGMKEQLDAGAQRMIGMRGIVTGGCISRQSNGRIIAKLHWGAHHEALLMFQEDKKINNAEFVLLGDILSTVKEHPSIFDMEMPISLKRGESFLNPMDYSMKTVDLDMTMIQRAQGIGYLHEATFRGEFTVEYVMSWPQLPVVQVSYFGFGDFEIALE
jgi:hypothetical protein